MSLTAPTLSPDGRWLAYVSDESGRREVSVRPFPNAGQAKWQVSTGGGSEPVWAHSGKELFYRNGAGYLIAAEVRTAPALAIGEQRSLFSMAPFLQTDPLRSGYAVTPDDQGFIMIRPLAGAEELIVVENWFEEAGKTRIPLDPERRRGT